MPNIFEELTGTTPQGDGELRPGPWWCEYKECFEVDDEAMYYPEDKTVRWTCEEGHKNKVKSD